MIIRRRVIILVTMLVVTLAAGTLGYRLIEGWPWLDALYMTVITLTTVGFGEIRSMSPAGRLFTMLIIFGGVGIVTYAITSLTNLVASGQLGQILQERRRIRMNNHTIVCGFGRVGQHVAAELAASQQSFVVVDRDDEAVEHCIKLGYTYIQGDANDEEILQKAGIDTAKTLVTAVSSDAENVFTVLTAREIRNDLFIIARCNDERTNSKFRKAGADRIISPYALAGSRIVNMISRPTVTDFLDGVLYAGKVALRLEELDVAETSFMDSKTLGELDLRRQYGVTVLAVDLPEEKVITHPEANTLLAAGSRLIVLGTAEQLQQITRLSEPER